MGPEYFAHDFIYALFLPHVVLLVFIYLISTTTFVFRSHRGLGALFGIAAYVFIIYSGWYAIMANLLVFWLALTIFISMGYFFLIKFIHPGQTKDRFNLGGKIAESIKSSENRTKAIRELINHRKELEKMKSEYESELHRNIPDKQKSEIKRSILKLDSEIANVKREIKKYQG